MALAKLQQDYSPSATPAPQLSTELDGFAPAPSPALALQKQLAQRAVIATTTDAQKWPPRQSLALIVTASLALWMALLMAGSEATKLIA